MIEWAAIRSETRRRCLFQVGRKPVHLTHQRNTKLHGGGHVRTLDAIASADNDRSIQGSIVSLANDTTHSRDSIRLDFLYPHKAVEYLVRKRRAPLQREKDAPIQRKITPNHTIRRGYTSTQDPANGYTLGGGPGSASGLPLEAAPSNPTKNGVIQTLGDLKRSGQPGLFDLAWKLYQQEPSPSLNHRRFMVNYLKQTDKNSHKHRIRSIVAAINPADRAPGECEILVRMNISLGNPGLAFESLSEVVKFRSVIRDCGFEAYMAFYVRHGRWDLVLRAYALLRGRTPGSRRDFRELLNTTRMVFMEPGFTRSVVSWASGLPNRDDVHELKLDLAQDLLLGCLYMLSRPGSYWSPDWEYLWGCLHTRPQWSESVSRNKWERSIEYLFSNGKNDLALKVYNDYRKTRAPRHIKMRILHHTIETLGQRNDLEAMQKSFADIFMVSREGGPNRHTYITAMKHLARKGEVESVIELFNMIISRYGAPTAGEIASVMHSNVKRGDLSQVVAWFNRVSDEFNLKPTLLCYNVLISAYARLGDVESALERVEELTEVGLKPDGATYFAIMEVCASRGDMHAVRELLGLVESGGHEIKVNMYNLLASACVNAGRIEEAHQVLDIIAERFPDRRPTEIWNIIISGYLNAGEQEKSSALFGEMVSRGVPFDSTSYGIAMHWLCLADKIENAEEMLENMKQQGLPASTDKYAILMVGYAQRGDFAKVCEAFNAMIEQGLTPSFETLGILLKAYANFEWEENKKVGTPTTVLSSTEELLAQVIEHFKHVEGPQSKEPLPAWIFAPLIKIYTKEGALDRALEHFHKFLELNRDSAGEKAKPNLYMYECMMEVFEKSKDIHALKTIYSALKKKAHLYFAPVDLKEHRLHRGKILSPFRFEMRIPLSIFMRAMITIQDAQAVRDEVELLQSEGYELAPQNWNDWVQCLCLSGDLAGAVRDCEQRLMTHWESIRPYYRYKDRRQRPQAEEMPEKRPFIRTLEVVAAGLRELSAKRWQNDKEANRLWEYIAYIAPKTLEACDHLEDLEQRTRKEMAYRMARLSNQGSGNTLNLARNPLDPARGPFGLN